MNKAKTILYRHPWYLVIGIILLGVGIKVFLLITDRLPFNADEAVVGLMATHILRGELPIFFYGQSYMGSLDAMLVAGMFVVLGKSVVAIRIIQILLFCGTLVTTYQLAFRITGNIEAGWIAALLMAIPTVNLTLYSTISLGGYGEALFLGNLILLMGIRVIQKREWYAFLLLGLLAGFGLWVNGLILMFSIPVIALLFWKRLQKGEAEHRNKIQSGLFLLLIGGLLGAMPWWFYGFQHGFDSLMAELFGSAISNTEVGYLASLGLRLVSFVIFGVTVIFGLRPPWEIRWLVLPLIPLIVAIWVFILIGFRKLVRKAPDLADSGFLLVGVMVTTMAGFILTPFGNDPSGRYFLPFCAPLSIITGIYLTNMQSHLKNWQWVVLALLAAYNLGGIIQCWQKNPPGFTTQFDSTTIYDHSYTDELIVFLESNSITRGYTTYWISYPLAFLSDEKLIFIPRLPYHSDFGYTERDDRYPAYDNLVSTANDIAYITARQPWLDSYIRVRFNENGIKWQEKKIGDFTIFYHLQRVILPQEIGLGKSAE